MNTWTHELSINGCYGQALLRLEDNDIDIDADDHAGLQEVLPADIMLPEGRLESLLEQALTHQLAKMDVRVPQMPVSLLTDYSFSRGHIPTHTTQAALWTHLHSALSPWQAGAGSRLERAATRSFLL